MKRQRGLRSHYPSTRNPQPPTAPGSTAGSFSGETPPDPQPQGPALVTTVPPEETQRMSPIAASASRPVSVCPVPAHLRPTIIYSGRRKRFTASRNPGLLRLMSGAYLCPAPGRQRWEQRFMVSLARAIAAQQLLPSATCLSHTSAALVQGLAMWTREPDVYLAVSGHPVSPRQHCPRSDTRLRECPFPPSRHPRRPTRSVCTVVSFSCGTRRSRWSGAFPSRRYCAPPSTAPATSPHITRSPSPTRP